MTIPRVPTPAIALLAVLALGVLILWHAATLHGLVGWAAILTIAAAVYTVCARRRGPEHQARVRPPGRPLMAVVLASVAVLAAADYSMTTDLLPYGLILWCVAGLGWIAKIAFAALADGIRAIRSHWLRWLLPPSIGYLGMAIAISVPFALRVGLSSPALDDTARRIQSGEILSGQIASLGLFGDRQATLSAEGFVGFELGWGGQTLADHYWLSLVWIPEEKAHPPGGYSSCVHWYHVHDRWWMREACVHRR